MFGRRIRSVVPERGGKRRVLDLRAGHRWCAAGPVVGRNDTGGDVGAREHQRLGNQLKLAFLISLSDEDLLD